MFPKEKRNTQKFGSDALASPDIGSIFGSDALASPDIGSIFGSDALASPDIGKKAGQSFTFLAPLL